MRISRVILAALALALVAVAQCIYYYPLLPATVASHFGANGRPNGWQSKDAFFIFTFAIIAVLLSAFVALPVLLGRISPAWINLPHKEYWLAPERRRESLEFLQRAMEWFGVVALLFVMTIIQLVIQANLGGSPTLNNAVLWPLLAVFLLFETGWIVFLMLRFAKPR